MLSIFTDLSIYLLIVKNYEKENVSLPQSKNSAIHITVNFFFSSQLYNSLCVPHSNPPPFRLAIHYCGDNRLLEVIKNQVFF